jgi:hypothetical protein
MREEVEPMDDTTRRFAMGAGDDPEDDADDYADDGGTRMPESAFGGE